MQNQIGDKSCVGYQTQHLRQEIATVLGRFHAAHDCDGSKDAEESASGNETGADECAAVAAFAAISTTRMKSAQSADDAIT